MSKKQEIGPSNKKVTTLGTQRHKWSVVFIKGHIEGILSRKALVFKWSMCPTSLSWEPLLCNIYFANLTNCLVKI